MSSTANSTRTRRLRKSGDVVLNYLIDRGVHPSEIHGRYDRILRVLSNLNGGSYAIPEFSRAAVRRIRERLVETLKQTGDIDLSRLYAACLPEMGVIDEEKMAGPELAWRRSKKFLASQEWRHLRMTVLAKRPYCYACGAPGDPENPLHGDHILPRSIWPEYALERWNIQILCRDCNMGKGNTITKDFTRKQGREAPE